MYIDKIASMMMAMGVGSEYFGGVKPSKNSMKNGVRLRRNLPQFKKCESCGFEVVSHEIDGTGICNDCRGVER